MNFWRSRRTTQRQKHPFRLNKSDVPSLDTPNTLNAGRPLPGATDVRSSSVPGQVQRYAGAPF